MSGIAPSDLRTYVIRPALFIIGLGGDAAEELMLGTALQESGAGKYLSQLNGPARGVWQMEPATFNDLQTNFLASRRALSAAVDGLKAPGLEGVTQLCGNLLYACAMARLVYARHSDPLPAAGDIEAQAEYYKRIYNTAGGAATPAEYVANWKAAHP
jgi:hypothetical protein